MSDPQWSDARRLLNDLLDADPNDPAAWLEARCGDPDLRIEVERLHRAYQRGTLSEGDKAAGWLTDIDPDPEGPHEAGVDGRGAGLESEGSADPLGLEGRRVGGYHVETLIGRGGMGIVYRARDPELGRQVALKFLPPNLARSAEVEERFLREARSASALEHPHIATVYETGQAEGGRAAGQRFIAMAYYDGRILTEKLEQEGPLPVEEAVGHATQIADALARAHRAGIVHRDVKPANVMITEAGMVKLLDFGLAKAAAETRLTATGRRLGTVAYMSPEQAAGEAVGPPTDCWAMGSILYEMVGGERPFDGERDAAILYAIQHESPAPLTEKQPDVPSALVRVVRRCLQKDPRDRYASAEALLEDLRALRSGTGTVDPPSSPETDRARRGHGWLVGAVAVLLLGLAMVAGWAVWSDGVGTDPSPSETTRDRSIAVLPFEVSGEGTRTWRDGMVTMLSMNLDGAGGLRAIPDRRVFAAAEQVDSSAIEAGRSPALAVAEQAGARYAVLGSAVQLGETLRLGAEVHDVRSGRRLDRVEVQGRPDSVTALTDRLTRRVLDVLLEKSEERMPTVDLARITTSSLDALKAFLDGERHFRAGNFTAAIGDFESAVEMDSTFASAHVRLAISRAYAQEPGFLAPIRRAYRLSDRLSRRERRLLRAGYLYAVENREYAAVDSARQLTIDYPDDPTAWYYLGEFLTASSTPRGLPEAERAHEKAVALDPGVAPYRYNLANLAFSLHQDSALAARRIEALPSSPLTDLYRLLWDLNFGSPRQQDTAWARLDTLTLAAGWQITLRDALAHPTDRALKTRILGVLAERADVDLQPQVTQAELNLEVGRVDEAISQSPDERQANCELVEHRLLGYPIPDSLLRSRLAPSKIGSGTGLDFECAGLYLIERGRAGAIRPLMDRLRRTRDRPDSSPRERSMMNHAIRTLKGYRAYRAGSLQVARKHWEGYTRFGPEGAIWRGDLYRKLGRLKTAEGWYLAAWEHPVAHKRLGRLYEQMGRPAKAQAAYRRFLAAWAGADPELQGWAEDARERLRALGPEGAAG